MAEPADYEKMGEIQIRVRYSETDKMGALHHSNYLIYFETGRIELLRSGGLNYRDFEEQGHFLVVARAEIRYLRAARYDDLLTLRTYVQKVTPARIEHSYRLLRGDEVIAEGSTTLACVDRSGRLQRMPEAILGG